MEVLELLLLSIGLAMDAFSISICKGLSIKKYTIKKGITIGIYFGLFKTLMPLIRFLLGTSFEKIITNIDHWIVFILLFTIGIITFILSVIGTKILLEHLGILII
ncbi:MAG: manganese efflux pump [Bacilli bacterium]|nr:manganese efflux pump [Bacilli bacterium]